MDLLPLDLDLQPGQEGTLHAQRHKLQSGHHTGGTTERSRAVATYGQRGANFVLGSIGADLNRTPPLRACLLPAGRRSVGARACMQRAHSARLAGTCLKLASLRARTVLAAAPLWRSPCTRQKPRACLHDTTIINTRDCSNSNTLYYSHNI
ncbi:hypothetical protein GUJ93_ZPchr0007g6187 [Zizania palustris]|uniref:Uncharacterized protein n=1 Tax=Zizania palustris TaxID=103762 RepID=A0A8J5SLH8_ZIZPA|nr:hypothetical protein GUJ93_ZPchr0007g6187 [Zizania palustris]